MLRPNFLVPNSDACTNGLQFDVSDPQAEFRHQVALVPVGRDDWDPYP